ncbi:TPA: hypothetical protein DEP34_04130 [Candidatus Uhrbacteria bacterium]|nr:hypothetical protein [Candidatus Uhrbacteria bacterium]HCB19442.1 hypothetical protein [Candidatus Uhrbacteria bacterium]HCB19540.1 hypothetical protein [Candidatus Uhrbacteria bacterium]
MERRIARRCFHLAPAKSFCRRSLLCRCHNIERRNSFDRRRRCMDSHVFSDPRRIILYTEGKGRCGIMGAYVS